MEVSNIIMHPLPQMTNKGERKMKLSKLREKLENNKELRNKQAEQRINLCKCPEKTSGEATGVLYKTFKSLYKRF